MDRHEPELTAEYWQNRCDQLIATCKQLTLERNDAINRMTHFEARADYFAAKYDALVNSIRRSRKWFGWLRFW